MTREDRERVKRAIDARVRELLEDGNAGCAGCGCDRDSYTAGCRTCSNRRRRRERLNDPEFRERIRHYKRRSRARRMGVL